MRTPPLLFLLISGALTGYAQVPDRIVLKTRTIEPTLDRRDFQTTRSKSRSFDRSHVLIQFDHAITEQTVAQLESRRVAILGYLGKNAVSASLPIDADLEQLGVRWVGTLSFTDRISPLISDRDARDERRKARRSQNLYFIVEFHADVNASTISNMLGEHHLKEVPSPVLLPQQRLVWGSMRSLYALSEWDEVNYIFPASPDIIAGQTDLIACAGALTTVGPVPQSVPVIGDGWGGPEHNTTRLTYAFVSTASRLPVEPVRGAILAAMREWSKYIQLELSEGKDSSGERTVAIQFATGMHGDPYRFSPKSSAVAHSFYPAPPNPEPIAGDMHFDDDRPWNLGADLDVFSVALHEFGHALGLGHSDAPQSVMYPYYRLTAGLSSVDIAAIQSIYPAATIDSNPQ